MLAAAAVSAAASAAGEESERSWCACVTPYVVRCVLILCVEMEWEEEGA